MSEDDAGERGDGERGGEYDRPSLADKREMPNVYQPAEDSDLLARTVAEVVEPGDRALDVGTGSGYVARSMAEAGADVVGIDLNPRACEQAARAGVPVVRGDLVAPFHEGAFDVVACNPPYLPTPEDREWGDWLERALSGGPDGRRIIEPFVESVGRVLAPGGTVYLLASTLTDLDAVADLAAAASFETAEVAGEDHPYERLVVLRLYPL